jgi:two-component system, sensor histidine kinase
LSSTLTSDMDITSRNLDDDIDSTIDPELIEFESVALVQKQANLVWITYFINLGAAIGLFWGAISTSLLLGWAIPILVMTFIRIWHTYRCPVINKNMQQIKRWKNEFIFLQVINSCLWGIAPFVLSHTFDPFQLTYIIASVFISPVITIPAFSLILPAFYINTVLTFTLFVVYAFSVDIGDKLHFVSLCGGLFFIPIYIKFAHNVNKSTLETFRLRYENLALVDQLKKEKYKAEKANTDKSRFLAAASHDLRQPLHALGLFVENLGYKAKDEEDKLLISNINQATGALQELFNSLLDISRLDAGVIEVKKEHFYIKSIYKILYSEFKPIAENLDLNLIFEETDAVIYSDKILSERILRNLISNAIKYTNKGSINVNTQQTDNKVIIKIIDTGIGVSDKEIELIFNEFYQINNPERDRSKGLGLGLSIVKRLASLMSLNLYIDSKESKGTTIRINFQPGTESEVIKNIEPKSHHDNEANNTNILVIDDEVQILNGMNRILTNWGFNVSQAKSIDTAITTIKNGHYPDLIMTDFRLKNNITGLDAINELKKHLSDDVPCIIITGDTSPERIKEASDSGYPLIHKPVSPIVLRNAINQLLNSQLN